MNWGLFVFNGDSATLARIRRLIRLAMIWLAMGLALYWFVMYQYTMTISVPLPIIGEWKINWSIGWDFSSWLKVSHISGEFFPGFRFTWTPGQTTGIPGMDFPCAAGIRF